MEVGDTILFVDYCKGFINSIYKEFDGKNWHEDVEVVFNEKDGYGCAEITDILEEEKQDDLKYVPMLLIEKKMNKHYVTGRWEAEDLCWIGDEI